MKPGLFREIGISGALAPLGIVALVVAVSLAFTAIRPPTVDELEEDIWRDWVRFATDSQGLTIVDQLLEGRRPAGQQLVEALGRLIENNGAQFVVPTAVRRLEIRDRTGAVFAEWQSPAASAADGMWRTIVIPLTDPSEGTVGTLRAEYRFYGGGLESLPNIRRLQEVYRAALWLVGILAALILAAVIANLSRIRERAARLQSQQVTLDLAHQMCHELRNGLWSFSLEGKNLRQLFQLVEDYLRLVPAAWDDAARRADLPAGQKDRFLRALGKILGEQHVDPLTDLAASCAMAKDANQQIEAFSRYLNLTVEELDRNLLGAVGEWTTTTVRLRDAWSEACELLAMRFRSAGVAHREDYATPDDWIVADHRALVHVFVNLAKNAIEAMREQPAERTLEFAIRGIDGSVECRVRNSGPPIDPEVLPRVFERGFTTKRGAGRGTGLSLVCESVERMRGSIAVESTARDGTVFRLTFPQALKVTENASV